MKNDWANNRQAGSITAISDKKVIDKLGFCESLKSYYINELKQGYRVEKILDDTTIINVKLKTGSVCDYFPQALVPILIREKVGEIDADFSNKIDKYVKRSMKQRTELDFDFINDIGKLKEFGDLSSECYCCPVELLGYKKGRIKTPKLICGNQHGIEFGQEYKVFNHGFYQKTKKEINIGYLYPRGSESLMKSVVNAIYSFGVNGVFQGEKDKYITKGYLIYKRHQ